MSDLIFFPTVHAEETPHAEMHDQVQRPGDACCQPNCAGDSRGVPNELNNAQRNAQHDESDPMILNCRHGIFHFNYAIPDDCQ